MQRLPWVLTCGLGFFIGGAVAQVPGASPVIIPKEILLPTPTPYAEIADLETKRTSDLFNTLDSELVAKIKARGTELAPQNVPVRWNYFGEEYGMKGGSLVKFAANGSEEIVLSVLVLPQGANIVDFRLSPDRKRLAYGYSFFGSDWHIWRIFDLVSNSIMDIDGQFVLKGFGGSPMTWMPDSKRIVYQKDLSIDQDYNGVRNSRIAVHEIGSDQAKDRIVFENFESPDLSRWGAVAAGNDDIVVHRLQGVATIVNAAYLVNLKNRKVKTLIPPNRYLTGTPGLQITGLKNGILYLRSEAAGDHFGIVAINIYSQRPFGSRRTIVPQNANAVLYQAMMVGDKSDF